MSISFILSVLPFYSMVSLIDVNVHYGTWKDPAINVCLFNYKYYTLCLLFYSFSCAGVVQVNGCRDVKKFEFYGDPRLWDGKTIKRNIKGNSSLYILEDGQVGT